MADNWEKIEVEISKTKQNLTPLTGLFAVKELWEKAGISKVIDEHIAARQNKGYKVNNGYKIPKIQEGVAVARHEAPRGQLVHMVAGNGKLENFRVSIHVPSYRNTPTVPFMLRGNTVADAGLIIASIDPCFSCLDR